MIEFKKIFGIWLVLASGTVAAMDSNSREGKRRIVANGDGVPAAVPVVPELLARRARARAELERFKRQRAAEQVPVVVPEPDTGDLTEEDYKIDLEELILLIKTLNKRVSYKACLARVKDDPARLKAYRERNARYREKLKANKEAAAQKKAQM